ncbi:MAG: TonB-dependent siderophore receptor [Cyanobacteria bacterium P01_F01_bin.143]
MILLSAIAILSAPPSLANESERDKSLPRNTATNLVAQRITRVAGVEVTQTKEGLELVLETAAGNERLVPLFVSQGNDLIIDILDATLAFELRNGVIRTNPVPGITTISVNSLDENSIRIKITGEQQAPSAEVVSGSDGLVLSVTPERVIAESDESIEIIATGEVENDDYLVPDASTATRTNTPIRDIPQSIQVIPQQVIEDQQAIGLDEILTNVSGVVPDGSNGNFTESFNIRGFDNTPVLQDGFRQFGGFGQNFVETANLEQVEVLKGPASILYGEIEPGGIINLVTKKPLAQPLYEAKLQLGNRALVRPQIDFSDALTSDGRLSYRLNALYRHENSFRDFDQDFKRFFIAPVISWQIGDRTDLTIQLDYTDDESPFDTGLPASGNGIVDVPFESIIEEPDSIVENETINIGYSLEHRFSDNWRLRNAFRFSERDIFLNGPITIDFDQETGDLSRFLGIQNDDIENYTLQTNVVGEFDTGSVQHTLLFGVDLNRTDDRSISRFDFFALETLNIFDPVFGVFDNVDPDDVPVGSDVDVQSDRLGIYLQDQIEILDNLILLAGVRYDTIENTTVNGPDDFGTEASETTENFDDVNPRFGLVYQPIPQISLFGSYSQSFSPSFDTDSSGDLLEPEKGEGFEFGVKGEILEGKLLATLGYFNITKKNVATPDPEDFFSSVATGEQSSQGIEFDLIGEIMPGWNIVASYAYIDAEVTEDNAIEVGNRLFIL